MQPCWDFMKCKRGPEAAPSKRCIATYYPSGSCYLVAGNWSANLHRDCARNLSGKLCSDCKYFKTVIANAPLEQAGACWQSMMSRWLGN